MKHLITAFCILFLGLSGSFGQGTSAEKKAQIRAQKVGYLTSEVGLTPQVAEKFWPVYNERERSLDRVRKDKRQARKDYRNGIETKTDAELEKLLDKEFTFRQEELDIRKQYHAKFKKLIGIKKTAKLYRAEIRFDSKLIRGVRDKADKARKEGSRSGTRP